MSKQDERIAAEVLKAIRAERARYAREWRKKNPDKQKAIVERYWQKRLSQVQGPRNNEQPGGDG